MPVLAEDDIGGRLADDFEDLGRLRQPRRDRVRLDLRAVVLGQPPSEANMIMDRHRLLLVGEDEDATGIVGRLLERL